MGVVNGTMWSDALGMKVGYTAVLPEGIKGPYEVLYLLHGHSDDQHAWLYNTGLTRYLGERNLAVFMPQVHLSFYTDMVSGGNYWTFISEEFPQKLHHMFRLSDKREENFVAGLSMGGYGAFKLGLRHPERFRGAASFSGAVDIVSLWEADTNRNQTFTLSFGSLEALRGSDDDLVALIEKLSPEDVLPSFYQSCGTEDFLIENNRLFKKLLEPFDLVYKERPGTHNWDFWDGELVELFKWMDGIKNDNA
ncbi:alpha/beta hydrolase [Jeotgalibaca sp. A127]|uniref:alpha/beta hydrolase n=1 Tax=Jeotgalibaca sp. A127 TaxID=3457324 RepID=UPI003FD63ED6